MTVMAFRPYYAKLNRQSVKNIQLKQFLYCWHHITFKSYLPSFDFAKRQSMYAHMSH